MYYYTDDQNSCKKYKTRKIPMKATIICCISPPPLPPPPPGMHTSHQNPVPAAIIRSNTECSSGSLSYSSEYYDKNSGYSDINYNVATNINESTNDDANANADVAPVAIATNKSGSCCHHWEHKNYDYEKNKPKTTTNNSRVVTVETPTSQQRKQQQQKQQQQKQEYNHHNNQKQQEKGQEKRHNKKQQQSGRNSVVSTHHRARALRSRNCSNNNTNTSTIRQQCRNFYNLKENITSLRRMSKTSGQTSVSESQSQSELESSPSTSPSPSLSLSSSPSSLWHCRTLASKNAKNAESTLCVASPISSFWSTIPSSASASASASLFCDLEMKASNNGTELANDRNDMVKANGNTMWNDADVDVDVDVDFDESVNAHLDDDSLTLRTQQQLVMPIVIEDRRRRSVNRLVNEKEMVCRKVPETKTHTQKQKPSPLPSTLPLQMLNSRRQRPTFAKEMDTIDINESMESNGGDDWRERTTTTTIVAAQCNSSFIYTSATIASANISKTTNTQFIQFGELCSRRTNSGDIETHEVENFKWSDADKGDSDDYDVENDANGFSNTNANGYGDGNVEFDDDGDSKSTNNTTERSNRIMHERERAKSSSRLLCGMQQKEEEEEQQQHQQQQEQKVQEQTMHDAESENVLQRRAFIIQRRQQLWQQTSVTLAMAMVAMATAMVAAMLQHQRHQVVKMFSKTQPKASKLLLSTIMLLMLITTANCWAGRQDVPSNCTFPLRWEGSWFLSGYQQSIHIKGSQISYRGKCAASEGNKYLIVDEKGCHRCLVIYEKHENVLQYKESECEGDSMYMHQSNPSAMAMRSVLNHQNVGGEHRGGAHPNTNGHSRLSSSDQYIMRSNDDMNDCPPDFCKGRETLQNLCDQIPGDALLYSLFRENAEPVKCPLKGPFIFTYNRGHGECKSPVSNIESCTEDSRLLLSFQACPDVQGTESTVEELTCLAAWKDGNSRYLVGLVSHHHAISNEERYRCFVYEKISTLMGGPSMISSKDAEYKLAQSGDATCNGLDSAEVGSRIMTLRKPPIAERCDFPVWFKGPRHWHALMGNAVYNYHTNDGSVHIIKSNGYMETRALCEQINKQTATEMMAVVHYTTGCQSGFMCMMFYRRDTHVIEIQTGKQASRLEDACAPDHFDIHKMPYITLLASNPDPQICPMEGLYNLRGAIGPPYLTTRHKRNHNNKAHSLHGHHHFSSDAYGGVGGGGGSGSASSISNAASGVGSGSSSSIIGSTAGDSHKRRGTLSFRNSERIERGSWHANTRGLPIRSRRDALTMKSKSLNAIAASGVVKQTNDSTSNLDGKELLLRAENIKSESNHNPTSLTTNATLRKTTTQSTSTSASATAAAKTATTTTTTTNSNSLSMMMIAPTDLAIVRQRNRRDVPGCITNFKAQRQLWVGCTEPNVIDVRPLCNDEGDEEYYCHGSWTENTTVYIIARHKRTKHGVCISYRPTEGSSAKLIIGDACYRGSEKPPEHHLVANLSVFGKCGETGSAASAKIQLLSYCSTLAVALLATLFNNARLTRISMSNLHMRR